MTAHNKDSNGLINMPLGISFSIGEVIFTVGIAAIVKLISNDVSVFTILFFRYLFCLPLLFATAYFQRGRDALQIENKGTLALRSLFGIASFGFLFTALETVELSKMTALLQTIPVFVTLLAPILIGETVGWRRRIAVMVGFIGVALIIEPSNEGWFHIGILFGIMSPFFGALMLLTLRRLGQSDHPASTALWYNLAGAAVFLIISIALGLAWPTSLDVLIVLGAIGIMSSFQQFFLANSYKLAPASTLAPLRYLSVPIGVGLSIIMFDEVITSSFYIGSAVLIAASFFIMKRAEKTRTSS
jgi:drug/metabolite transporter (DMT)-like permease